MGKTSISFYNILLFIITTIMMILLLLILVGIMNYKQIIGMIRDEKIEMFSDTLESRVHTNSESSSWVKSQELDEPERLQSNLSSESIMKALEGMIKTANKVGKKMLNPELWSERLKLINKSPMELARMELMKNTN